MRGKRRLPQQILRRLRIIPAHAGQTRPGTRPASRWSDHPRACGANVAVPVTLIMVPGSSPRMRGKHMHMDMSSIAARIIPAHAGQTAPVCNPNRPPPDHPRACGANEVIYERLSQLIGSSPRMRGKPITPVVTPKQQRIIPAHAGQTMACTPFMPKRSDHPRACGANRPGNRTTATRCGSSPRMRGKPDFLRVPLDTLRIIPAHAGQTRRVAVLIVPVPDHPRACGANGTT